MSEDMIDMGHRETIQLIIAPGGEASADKHNHITEEKFPTQKKESEYRLQGIKPIK